MLYSSFFGSTFVPIERKDKRMGRQRDRKLNVYLLEEEWEILQAKKDEAGMSQSDYVRNMILFGAAHERTIFSKETEKKLIYELNKIGTNLNQIAARANASKNVDKRDFDTLYQNYLELLTAYDKYIRGKSNGDY